VRCHATAVALGSEATVPGLPRSRAGGMQLPSCLLTVLPRDFLSDASGNCERLQADFSRLPAVHKTLQMVAFARRLRKKSPVLVLLAPAAP